MAQEPTSQTPKRLISGEIISHGAAPYKDDPNNNASYFVELKLDTPHKGLSVQKLWGVDLRDRMEANPHIDVGSHVLLADMGNHTVQVPDPKNAGEWIETKRNIWHIEETEPQVELENGIELDESPDLTKLPDPRPITRDEKVAKAEQVLADKFKDNSRLDVKDIIAEELAKDIPEKVRKNYQYQLKNAFTNNEHLRFYANDNPSVVAFEARTKSLQTTLQDEVTINAMLDVAQSKGWDKIKLKGTEEFKQKAWLEASLRGIETKGYKPDDKALAMLEAARATRNHNQVISDVAPTKEAPAIDAPTVAAATAEPEAPTLSSGKSISDYLSKIKQATTAAFSSKTQEDITQTPDGEKTQAVEAPVDAHKAVDDLDATTLPEPIENAIVAETEPEQAMDFMGSEYLAILEDKGFDRDKLAQLSQSVYDDYYIANDQEFDTEFVELINQDLRQNGYDEITTLNYQPELSQREIDEINAMMTAAIDSDSPNFDDDIFDYISNEQIEANIDSQVDQLDTPQVEPQMSVYDFENTVYAEEVVEAYRQVEGVNQNISDSELAEIRDSLISQYQAEAMETTHHDDVDGIGEYVDQKVGEVFIDSVNEYIENRAAVNEVDIETLQANYRTQMEYSLGGIDEKMRSAILSDYDRNVSRLFDNNDKSAISEQDIHNSFNIAIDLPQEKLDEIAALSNQFANDPQLKAIQDDSKVISDNDMMDFVNRQFETDMMQAYERNMAFNESFNKLSQSAEYQNIIKAFDHASQQSKFEPVTVLSYSTFEDTDPRPLSEKTLSTMSRADFDNKVGDALKANPNLEAKDLLSIGRDTVDSFHNHVANMSERDVLDFKQDFENAIAGRDKPMPLDELNEKTQVNLKMLKNVIDAMPEGAKKEQALEHFNSMKPTAEQQANLPDIVANTQPKIEIQAPTQSNQDKGR